MSSEKSKKATNTPLTVSSFYENEDRLAQNLSNEKITAELERILGFMRKHISSSSGSLKKDSEMRDALLVKAVMLRRLNRLSNFRNHLLRERLASSRTKVDAHYLQLQNIRCGISHLKNAITACLEFQSMDGELDLIPVEEFYNRAPTEISRPEVTKTDSHQLYLARLNFELEERKNMLGNLQELEGRKSVLLSDIRGKELRLSQIKPKISALKQCARPLLDILALKSVDSSRYEAQKKFAQLPMQLELLRLSASVYNELFNEEVDISPEGDTQKFERCMQAELRRRVIEDEDEPDGQEEDEDDEMDVEEEDVEQEEKPINKSKKNRRRKNRSEKLTRPAENLQSLSMAMKSENMNIDDGNAEMVKTEPNVSDNSAHLTAVYNTDDGAARSGARTLEKRLQKKRDILLSTHPISLNIIIHVPNLPNQKNAKLRLSFFLLTELNCVGLKCKIFDSEITNWLLLDGENLLDDLFDGDFGRRCSNATTNALLNTVDMDIAKYALLVGKPYDFVQKLCGLLFFSASVAKVSSSSRYSPFTTTTREHLSDRQLFELFADMVARVRARVVARFSLTDCILQLENCKNESIFAALPKDQFPVKVLSKLVEFGVISIENALAHTSLSFVQKSLLSSLIHTDSGAVHYKLIVERTNASSSANFMLDAFVHVPSAYPRRSPVFLLMMRSEACAQSLEYTLGVAELERYINTLADQEEERISEMEAKGTNLLLLQVAHLCSRLDVVLEVIAQRIANCTNTQPEFSTEHSFVGLSSGAEQNFPLIFDTKHNIFCFELPWTNRYDDQALIL